MLQNKSEIIECTNTRKKVLVIAEFPSPYRVEVFKGLSVTYDMDIFFSENSDQSRSPEYIVKSGTFKFGVLSKENDRRMFNNCLKKISDYDFVLAYHPVCKSALRAEFLCRLHKVPYFVNIDGAFVNPSFVKDIIKRFVYKNAIGCLAGSKSAIKYYLYYGVNQEKIIEHKFTNLYKSEILEEPLSESIKENIKEKLGLHGKKVVISIGQFIKRKGFDVLLEAWNQIQNEEYELVLIGGGPERSEYEKIIKEKAIKNVRIIDYLPKDKITEYYQASDLFVLATREDVWGLVINEAFANGVPAITTNMCNAGTQLIQEGITGYIVQSEDADSLAKSICKMLTKETTREIGIKCIESIEEYTYENVIASHCAAIDKLLLDK